MKPGELVGVLITVALIFLWGVLFGLAEANETHREIGLELGRAQVGAQACPLLLESSPTIQDSLAVADLVPACWDYFPTDTARAAIRYLGARS